MKTPLRRRLRPALAAVVALLGLSLAAPLASADSAGLTVKVTVPERVTGPFTVANALLRWGINAESGSGAFYGDCNFLSAGAVGNTGSGKLWTATDGYYQTTSGAVTIEKPYDVDSVGTYKSVPFADRCLDVTGTAVTTSNGRNTGITAAIADGTGTVDPSTQQATINWTGSFTIVGYGGLAYWWITDPTLVVNQGTATLTGTVGGFGSSRDDTTIWTALTPRTVTLATMTDIDLSGALGFTTVPAYRGVSVTLPAAETQQLRTGDDWGSFPQSLIDFHLDSGQASYYYSSGGIRDAFKPASRLWVSYDATAPVTTTPDTTTPTTTDPVTDPDAGTGTDTGTTDSGTGAATGGSASGGSATNAVTAADALAAAAGIVALAATTLLPLADTLVPQLAQTVAGQAFTWAVSGFLAALALTALGFQRGWLVWPAALIPRRLRRDAPD